MNGLVAGSALDSLQSAGAVPKSLRGAITYVAGTTGAIGTTTLFTVTGDVLVTSFAGKCTTDLTSAGAPTFNLGVATGTSIFGGGPDVTGWDADEWFNGANNSYDAGGGPNLVQTYTGTAITGNIIQTIASATITGGVVRWYVSYIPLSADGAITLHANLAAF